MAIKVRRGGSVMHPNGSRVFSPGEIIPDGLLSKSTVSELVRSGFVVTGKFQQGEPDLGGEYFVEHAPGVAAAPRLASGEGNKGVTTNSPWTLDPDGLRGLDLDMLNVMVQERDASLEPFKDAAEAVGWLSQDYTEPAKV